MYFVIYHGAVFGGIYYVLRAEWVPMFAGWNGGFFGINFLGGLAWVILFITYAAFIIGLITSVFSCFDSTKLTEKQIGQLSVFGTLPEWGKNQKNGRFGLFLGMPPFMVKITPFTIETKTIEVKDESIQVQTPTSGEQFSIVCDGQFKWCFRETLTASKNAVRDDDLKNLYKAAATSWFADPTHRYRDVDEAKLRRSDILSHIESEMTGEALRMYGVEISGVKIINLETPKVQRDQQDKNAALLDKIMTDEAAEMMSLKNHHKKVDYAIKRFKKITGVTTITPEILKGIEDRILVLDKTVKRSEIKGNVRAFTSI